MKTILAVSALALFVVVFADENTHQLAEALIHRGEELIHHTNHILKEQRNHSLDHLIETVEHELAMVEALVFTLKYEHNKENSSLALHHIHLQQENLLHLENRISEELAVIDDVLGHEHLNQSADKLIAHAKSLIEHAKQVAKNYANGRNQKEINSIEHEIQLIQKLITKLELHPTGEELHREEQTLVRNQQTLLHLIERVVAHDEHHKHNPTSAPHEHHTVAPPHVSSFEDM